MPRRPALATCTLLLLAVLPGLAAAQQSTYQAGSSPSSVEAVLEARSFRRLEVIMEVGLALPQADLSAPADTTFTGYGQFSGYLLGIRVRIYLARSFALAPYVSYNEFGAAETTLKTGPTTYDQFLIQAKTLNVGVDATWVKAGALSSLRPLVSAGAAFTKNKYREEFIADGTYYSTGANVLTWSLTAGIRLKNWELTGTYQINQFTTARFYPTGGPRDYDWGNVALKVGYVLPEF